ncbi:rhamnan synthesis F family protein [Roseovarius nanhaiticus]|uniref:rhamnan synthesis F family protein n=1 Tax=Roseovarius nanhaiticus TaxID=573024 RepID=UPI00248F878C|nr:rhamnan synthesis F family protein [Roseovarius nanhaiticus]
MKKNLAWKLKRELRRLGRQTLAVPRVAWEYTTLTIRYDIQAARERKVHAGERPQADEVAIYLIFPSKGVLASHLDVLNQLTADGISPILVSNLKLSQQDLATLKPLCTRIIERPNVGYDFGGYRDGVLNIADDLTNIDRLYLLNDSCWMVDSQQSWFKSVRDANVDFCGATAHYGIRPYRAHEFRDIDWTYTTHFSRFHYGSYALAMSTNILRDPGFLKFWRNIRLSNDKNVTVRRGETGLTQWMLRRKRYSHVATCQTSDLGNEIEALSDDELDAVVRTLVLPAHPKIEAQRDDILKKSMSTPIGRFDRIKVILTAVSSQGMSYAMPYYNLRYRDFQFVKKSPLWLSQAGSDTMLALLDRLNGPMGRNAAREARTLRPGAWPIPTADTEISSQMRNGRRG